MTKRYLQECCFYNFLDFLIAIPSTWILLVASVMLYNYFNFPSPFQIILSAHRHGFESVASTQCLEQTHSPFVTNKSESFTSYKFGQSETTPITNESECASSTHRLEETSSPFATNIFESVISTQHDEQTTSPVLTNKPAIADLIVSVTTNSSSNSNIAEMSDSQNSQNQTNQIFKNTTLPILVLFANYFLILLSNPKRWILAAALLPKRILLTILAVILNPIGFVCIVLSLGSKVQKDESARIANDRRYRKKTRDDNLSNFAGFLVITWIFGALAESCFSINKILLGNFRSFNRKYTLIDDPKDSTNEDLGSDLGRQRPAQPITEPKQEAIVTHANVIENEIQANKICITNTDLRIDNDKSPIDFKLIKDKYPQELFFFVVTIPCIIASKFFSPDLCAFIVLICSIVHLFARGRVIFREGLQQKKYLRTTLKLFILLPLADILVLLIMLAIIL